MVSSHSDRTRMHIIMTIAVVRLQTLPLQHHGWCTSHHCRAFTALLHSNKPQAASRNSCCYQRHHGSQRYTYIGKLEGISYHLPPETEHCTNSTETDRLGRHYCWQNPNWAVCHWN